MTRSAEPASPKSDLTEELPPMSTRRPRRRDGQNPPAIGAARWARRRRSLRVAPDLQPLELRRLLATFTVVNTADSGAGSLRQAIIDANGSAGADIIDFNIGSGLQTIIPTT